MSKVTMLNEWQVRKPGGIELKDEIFRHRAKPECCSCSS